MRNLTRAAAVGLVLLTIPPGWIWGAEIAGIDIVRFGIYTRDAEAGASQADSGLRLVQQTDFIPAITGDNFYVEYVVTGEPEGAAITVEERVTLTPMGVENPSGDRFFVKSRKQRKGRIGGRYLAGWGLDEGEYIEPGVWKVQIWIDGALLAEKMFNIVLP
ncbi:MAG: DUF3859 domain-containing protein [SAR324 cluster bacterium]|nr:DUF3859 domain-containing protein [SAR324 cluster bacterium]